MSWIRGINRLNLVWAFLVVSLIFTILGTLICVIWTMSGTEVPGIGIFLLIFPPLFWVIVWGAIRGDLQVNKVFFRAAIGTNVVGTIALVLALFSQGDLHVIYMYAGMIILAWACFYWWQTARRVRPFQENQLEGEAS